MGKKLTVLVVTTIFFLSSCATIFTGTKDKITFKSTPSGASVRINGVEECITPCTVQVKRSMDDTEVELKLDSYETRLIKLSKKFNFVSAFNLTNLLAWGIDVITGAIMKYDRKVYDITLDDNKTTMVDPTKNYSDSIKNTLVLNKINK